MTSPAAVRAFWWFLGCTVASAAPLAAIWTVNRNDLFWVALVLVGLGGAAASTTIRVQTAPPGSVMFAAIYPLSIAGAIIGDSWQVDGDIEVNGAATILLVAALIGAIPVIGIMRTRPASWFVGCRNWWTVVALLLFFVYGLGIMFIPLAVAGALSARSLTRSSAVEELRIQRSRHD